MVEDNFDVQSNYDENSSFSEVIFGAKKQVLEVELNEMQEIQKTLLGNVLKSLIGNGISDKKAITYFNNTLSISDCFFAVNGYLVHCNGLSISAKSGDSVYLQVWEDTVDHTATLKKAGNEQSTNTIPNYIKDSRIGEETSRRKVVKYTLTTTTDSNKENLPIATISDDGITLLVKEVNLTNLSDRLSEFIIETANTYLPLTGGAIKGDLSVSGAINGNLIGNAETATKATSAGSATKATQDGDGNVISSTYSKTNHTHNYAGSSSAGGVANSATKLATARTIRTNLGSTSTANFDGSANITPGVTGTLPVANGGTGKTTLVDSANALINALSTGSSDPEDDDYYVSQYAGGEQNTYHRRPVSALWEYIKGKISSVLGLTASQYSGNAATATKATSADSATKATQDGDGNVIADTYAEKETIALKSATGASISIADSKEAPMILNYAPVNLFNHSFATTTIGGITFTANANGTITANGTATGNMEVSIGTHTFTDADIGKTFCWSDNGISAITDINWNAYIYLNNINGVNAWRGHYRFVVEKAHNVVVKIYIAKGTVLENKVYRPMLEEGSTYHTYVPYTGYDIVSCGKNLIGSVPKSTSGIRCSVKWNGDDVTVTSTVSNAWIGYSCNAGGLKPNTKYTISAEVEASTTNIYNGLIFGSDTVSRRGYGKSGNVTLTNSTDANGKINILFLVDNKGGGSSGDYAIFKNIMLEEGDTASGYEASKSTSVTINSETIFPVNGLESYDGLTNVLNPYSATMEVTYATNEAGQGILKEIETKAEIDGSNAKGDWDINITGNAKTATSADSATKATQDKNGNVITDTYAKKSIYGNTAVSLGRVSGSTVGSESFAYGRSLTVSSTFGFSGGYNNTVSGDAGTTFGKRNTASGECSFACGDRSKATGYGSFACGDRSIASGYGSFACGISSTASGYDSFACGNGTIALKSQHAQGYYNDTTTATDYDVGASTGTAFVIGNGTSYDARSNAFRVTGQGITYAKGAYNTSGADYAEFAEWADGNTDNEDRRGYFVTFDEEKTNMIRKANEGDYILGIVSGNPCIVGNSDEGWLGKYVFDEFGAHVYEEVEEQIEYVDEETGETKTKTELVTTYKLNPDYDPERGYTHRKDRQEWDYVGWMGVLSVRDDNTCVPGGYCKVADGGIATSCERGIDTYRVIKRVTDNIVKIILK